MEDPVVVLEAVKVQEVEEFSNDESVEIIPASKRGGEDTDSDDDDESVKSDDSDEDSKESDDASKSETNDNKKVTWKVDKPTTRTTRSGRLIQQAPAWIRAIETGMANAATSNYYASLAKIEQSEVIRISMVENEYIEYVNVRAGLGGGFENTAELKPMKYEQAIKRPDNEAWKVEIGNEHD